MKRILTGIKPTGDGMHIGNYLGMYRPFIENSKGKDSFLMVADYHSLTSVHNKETLENNKKRLLCELFALLPENENITIFEQSKVTHINNITWILSSVTPYGLMMRAHAFKDAQNKNVEINMATFNYPLLMTSDIISYDVDLVPVGKDQKQHLEFTRDIAGYFNKTYNTDLFKLPEPYISEDLGVIPGLDGRKMSKSYNNFIGVFDDAKTLKKKVMKIVTSDEPLNEPKDPDKCNVFKLISFFADKQRTEEIRGKYLAGGYGYGHAKYELLEILDKYFEKARQKYEYYMNNFDEVEKMLEVGNKIANDIATEKYNKMMEIVGLK